MVDRIIAQGKYDRTTGGGSILHINCEEEISKEQMKQIIIFVAKNGVVYWAANYGLSQCKNCGKTFIGKLEKSPCHNAEVSHWLRVVGFLTEVEHWTPEHQKYFNERQFYNKFKIGA